ncbi:carboxypeptidase regulatory-like domain-containing protein [Gemmata sp. G18]|uniref:Carboxypeptidase regulatory-like domain-containing protein n=1 Tax=Gemmata palustris TaxID=2822762 RepID=A0ABS5BU83_9BACT|nr:carboxypeptidase-like regulatory domain-containing protein [Gemmata palustris]MBP3957248.1 carboxypeptidase regulatory-like domain-containing protein [Gemmata palustris]
MHTARSVFWTVTFIALVATTGCEKPKRYTPIHLVPVRGKVLTDGNPAAGATVRFHPRNAAPGALTPVAKTGPDGSFELTTYENQDGAPPGEYDVTLRLDEPTGRDAEMVDRFRGRFADPKKPAWHIRIEDRATELDPFIAK